MSLSRNQRRVSLSAASLAGDRRSRFGLFGSVVLHAAVIAATLFTWQHRLDITDESPPVVPVDLVTIGAKTNITPVAPKEKFKPKKQEPVTAPQVSENVPAPSQTAAPDVEMAPPPQEAPSEPVIKPKPALVTPMMRPRPTPRERRHKFDVNNILALLNKQKPAGSTQRGRTGEHARRGVGAQNAMTMDLVDALRNQIAQCWSPPVGAPNPEDLIVSFELFLNPDGSVARPPQLTAQSRAAAASSSYVRAAVEAGRRAIYTCAPYKLPADRYSQWRDITLVFDPRKMMGQ